MQILVNAIRKESLVLFDKDILLKLLSEWQHLGVRHIHINNAEETREIVDNEQILPRTDVTAIGRIFNERVNMYLCLHCLYKSINFNRFSIIDQALNNLDLSLPPSLRELYQFSNGLIMFEGKLIICGFHSEGIAPSYDLFEWNKWKKNKEYPQPELACSLICIGRRSFAIKRPRSKFYNRDPQNIYMDIETGEIYGWEPFQRTRSKKGKQATLLADNLQAFLEQVYQEVTLSYDENGTSAPPYQGARGINYSNDEFLYSHELGKDNQTAHMESPDTLDYVCIPTIANSLGTFSCYVGTIDDEGVFHPLKPEYAVLEPWVREQIGNWVRSMLGGGERVKESYLRFVHGEDWQDYIYYEEHLGYSVMRYKE